MLCPESPWKAGHISFFCCWLEVFLPSENLSNYDLHDYFAKQLRTHEHFPHKACIASHKFQNCCLCLTKSEGWQCFSYHLKGNSALFKRFPYCAGHTNSNANAEVVTAPQAATLSASARLFGFLQTQKSIPAH